MTRESEKTYTTTLADGVNTQWDFDFGIWKKADIDLIVTNALGAESKIDPTLWSLTLTTDTSGVATGGRVTYPLIGTPVTSGYHVSVVLSMEFVQETDLQINRGFNPEVVETILDKLTAYTQQNKAELARTVKVGIASTQTPDELIAFLSGLATSAAADAAKVETAISNLFVRRSEFMTVAGQTDYPLEYTADNIGYNVTVYLNGQWQKPKVAYILPNSTTIRFDGDPGVSECVVETSLSYANPDIKAIIDYWAQQAVVGSVRVSANDTTAGPLESKLLAGTGVLLTKENPGANEALRIAANVGTAAGTVCAGDDARLNASGIDTVARDLALRNTMRLCLLAGDAAGPFPGGFIDPFKTDTLATKTGATYNAVGDYYTNKEQAVVGPSTLNGTTSYTQGGTVIDRTIVVPNSMTITRIGVNSIVAGSGKIKVALRVSAGSYNIVYDQAITHTGSGLEWFTLTTPFDVPSSGTYHVAVYYGFTGTNSQTISLTRAYVAGDATGNGVTMTESSTTALPTAVDYESVTTDMTLIPAAITPGSAVTQVELQFLHKAVDAVTLNTDLKARATANGGTNWSGFGTIESLGAYDADYNIMKATFTGLTAGTAVTAEITTKNTKAQRVRLMARRYTA